MKATLCVFVALVAVTSAAPTFMANRRGACTDQRFCTTTCSCGTTSGDTCDADTKYCTTNTVSTPVSCLVASGGAAATDGTKAAYQNCACGVKTVLEPATQKVDATTGQYCYLSKQVGGAAATQAS